MKIKHRKMAKIDVLYGALFIYLPSSCRRMGIIEAGGWNWKSHCPTYPR